MRPLEHGDAVDNEAAPSAVGLPRLQRAANIEGVILLGEVAARAASVIEIRCGRCNRYGRLSVKRLLAEHPRHGGGGRPPTVKPWRR